MNEIVQSVRRRSVFSDGFPECCAAFEEGAQTAAQRLMNFDLIEVFSPEVQRLSVSFRKLALIPKSIHIYIF